MQKLKVGVIFGGMSTENEVSVKSAKSILNNLDSEKYEVFPIFIDKNGIWYKNAVNLENKEKIDDVIGYLNNLDLLFPVLHGLYGEDGTIQGLLELIKKPYVGCHVLASSIGMDKVYTKIIFEKADLNQAKYVYLRKYNDKFIHVDEKFNEKVLDLDSIVNEISKQLAFPVFIKPSNSGSSVGINKANDLQELKKFINYASKFDDKILVEEAIVGREVECAVLGNEDVVSSCVGEVKAADEFYSYEAKYENKDSRTEIPATLSKDISEKIRRQALKAFKAIDGKGLSRVDFFVEEKTNKIYINEINTMPGFTDISMYPKLFEESGISYKQLLDKLIELSMQNKNP